MEEIQVLHIRKNLHKLIQNTTCHSLFLAYLDSKSVLDAFETAILERTQNRFEKARKFYEIIVSHQNSYDVLCEALKETKQTGALQILLELKPIRFEVRQPVHLFTGREDELRKLHECISQNEKTATIVTQAASVTGLGGIGKTELCRRYIQLYSKEYDENIIWIAAEKPEQMENSFRTLAKDHLEITQKDADGREKAIKTVVDEVYNYFGNKEKKCLFVFDNAVSSIKEQDIFMPNRVIKRPFTLITSRDNDWELPFNVVVLEELKLEEAIAFVKKGLCIDDISKDKMITELVTRLQCFPLALQQAISFIKQQQLEIKEYLEIFENELKTLLDYNLSPFLSNKYANTTSTTWKITTDVIAADKESGSLAIIMLNLFSYLEPDKIPAELILRHENLTEDEIHSALQLIVKYSLISFQPFENTFGVHRLVQEVTRIELRSSKSEENILKKCLCLFKEGMDKKSLSHAMNAFDFSHNYPSLVTAFSSMPSKILYQLKSNNRINEIIRYGKKSVKILHQNLPGESIDIARTEFELGVAMEWQHNFEEGFKILNEYSENTNYMGHQLLMNRK